MKRTVYTLLLGLAASMSLLAQTTHTITLSGLSFTPQHLTIQAGDTVVWQNMGGFHNVNGDQATYPANPESFGSGPAANAPWTYSHVFNTPGQYDYRCDVHFGSGMTGTLTVQAGTSNSDVVISEIMYNNPGTDDYEFVELHNKGTSPIDMTGWSFSQGIDYTFGNYTLQPGGFVVLAIDSALFESTFGVPAFQFLGALNNGGETITLVDASGNVIDSVAYDDEAPWPTTPDGFGPSLVLCDYDADNNDPANWAPAITPTGVQLSGIEVLANPGADSQCSAGPLITFIGSEWTLSEADGSMLLTIALSNGNGMPTEVSLEINPASTATPGEDFEFIPPATVAFNPGNTNDTVVFIIPIIDDTLQEPLESIVVDLVNPTNNATIAPTGTYTIYIVDNDTPSSGALLISGIFDTQPSGAGVKGWELKAIKDIPDLSIYGVGSANNGGGSDGIEAVLPPIPLDSGQCFYVANNGDLFMEFFGFPADLVTGAAEINGDDAVELFENNVVVDVFGEINMGGTGTPWEYTDGWAYRKSGTGPDGNVFVLDHWTFSGVDALDGVPNNASAPLPFPTCSYSPQLPDQVVANDDNASTDQDQSVTIDVLANDLLPNPVDTLFVLDQPANGMATPNGIQSITYTPSPGFCGVTDVFSYVVCDAVGCDTASVSVEVACPPQYPAYDIATVTTVDANGLPDSLGVSCQLQGIVYGVDLQGNDNIQFFFADATGGISLFSNNNFGYTVTEGDEIIVQGTITQFNCLTQITPDTLWVVSTGNTLKDPLVTTVLDESTESELIRINNLTLVDPGQWTGTGSGFNVEVTNGSQTFQMRIDNDVDLYSMPPPSGVFHAIGLGSQFDPNQPCDAGYQFLPRYKEDIIPGTPTREAELAASIRLWPNPVKAGLYIQSGINLDAIVLTNMLGQPILSLPGNTHRIDLAHLPAGVYLISFTEGSTSWTTRIVKQ
ncbi:MAG: hypothetical protein KatS3mg029_0107 [Saprospiraceae bacterium]|nr:MAG: hypothetical protein KatS3mg029_0107 [Saprospiraceae bacterium]